MCLCYAADFITVSETAVEPPQDEVGMNSPTDLAMEATFINQNFSQQVLKRVSFTKSLQLFVKDSFLTCHCVMLYYHILCCPQLLFSLYKFHCVHPLTRVGLDKIDYGV